MPQVYVGAYFKIGVKEQPVLLWLSCDNGHIFPIGTQFCGHCGQPLKEHVEGRYPRWLELDIPIDLEDELRDITPTSLPPGEIYATGNDNDRAGCVWVQYGISSEDDAAIGLPSIEDAARMAAALMSDYAEVYHALLELPVVDYVIPAVGIVPYY